MPIFREEEARGLFLQLYPRTRSSSWSDPGRRYLGAHKSYSQWELISGEHVLGQVFPISPGGSAEATSSPSRLTSRSFSTWESLFLTLSRFTASTSMTPLEEPRTTISCFWGPCRSSTYLERRARVKVVPYSTEGVCRMNDPVPGTL